MGSGRRQRVREVETWGLQRAPARPNTGQRSSSERVMARILRVEKPQEIEVDCFEEGKKEDIELVLRFK